MLARPDCGVCGGTGIPKVETLLSSLDHMTEELDELSSTARDFCDPAVKLLDLAWWHVENAIRQITSKCSIGCKPVSYCACCHHFDELKTLAGRMARALSC